jgi:pimeloyl-ACP methyl ester carboxylesterase
MEAAARRPLDCLNSDCARPPVDRRLQRCARPRARVGDRKAGRDEYDARRSRSTGALHVSNGGKGGVPVVFVHSFGGDTSQWSAQLEHLRKTRRALAFDARGHGESEASAKNDYSVEWQAGDIAAVVDALGLERFVLVGHSMGGSVALPYASRHPARVAGLVLVATPGKIPTEQAQKVVTSLEGNFDATMEEYRSKLTAGAQPSALKIIEAGRSRMPKDRSIAIINRHLKSIRVRSYWSSHPAATNHTTCRS